MRFSIPVLNYHSANIAGSDYATNDHVAFRTDLDMLTDAGWTIRPLHRLVEDTILGRAAPPSKAVALTFDDGTDFDFVERIAKQLPMRMLGTLLGVPEQDGVTFVHVEGVWVPLGEALELPPGGYL